MKDRERFNVSCNYNNNNESKIISFLENETIAPTIFIKQILLDYINGRLVYTNGVSEVKEIEVKDNFNDIDIDLGI